jgi:hypothetical protein
MMRVTRGVWNREILFSELERVTLAEGTCCLLDFDKSCLLFEVDAIGDDEPFSIIDNGVGLLEAWTWIVFETAY